MNDELKDELFDLLLLAKQEPIKTKLGINLPDFVFIFGSGLIKINYNVGIFPEDASRVSMLIWEFCKTHKLKCEFGTSYFNDGNEVYVGYKAASKFLAQNFKEVSVIQGWMNILEESRPEELHQC